MTLLARYLTHLAYGLLIAALLSLPMIVGARSETAPDAPAQEQSDECSGGAGSESAVVPPAPELRPTCLDVQPNLAPGEEPETPATRLVRAAPAETRGAA